MQVAITKALFSITTAMGIVWLRSEAASEISIYCREIGNLARSPRLPLVKVCHVALYGIPGPKQP
jgi:hypothetical protein